MKPLALITGASAGIGLAYAEKLAPTHDLVVVARRKDRLDALAERLKREHGTSVEVLVADLTSDAGLAAASARAKNVSLLINNAGFGAYAKFASLDPVAIDALIEVHVRVPTRLTRAFLDGRTEGAVINVASLLAYSSTLPTDPLPMRVVYAASKSYLLAFTQLLAGELKGTAIKVQVCMPGLVATEFHTVQGIDLSRVPRMQAHEVVKASLAALEKGEVVCVPALADVAVAARVGEAERAVMESSRGAALASRYG